MNYFDKVEKDFIDYFGIVIGNEIPKDLATRHLDEVRFGGCMNFIKSKIREAVMEYRRLASIENDDTVGLAELGIKEEK